MARGPQRDAKERALAEAGALHPRPDSVRDELFQYGDFFDSRDLVQVKYEMLRRVHRGGDSVTAAAQAFGFSRPSFYEAAKAFSREGLAGLVPKRRGPRVGHKLTADVVDFLDAVRKDDPSLSARALAEELRRQRGLVVHPRSIERALARRGKGRRTR